MDNLSEDAPCGHLHGNAPCGKPAVYDYRDGIVKMPVCQVCLDELTKAHAAEKDPEKSARISRGTLAGQ